MKLYKKLILSIAALGLTTAVFADDWDDYSEETEEPTVTVSGKVEMNARAYVDQRDAKDDRLDVDEWKTDVFPSGKVNVNYSGLSSDVSMTLKFDKNSLANGYYWDILDEFTARAYVGNAQFEAGKMRVVWGKGDKIHVLDNFNANDYTDYIVPDYIDRRISEPMFRAVYSTNNNIKFEAIWTPMMTADRLGTGVWEPKASKNLTTKVTEMMTSQIASSMAGGLVTPSTIGALMNASSFDPNSLYPDTQTLKYGQAGARMTFTVGGADLGFSYYYGHNKQPSANVKKMFEANAAAVMKTAANESPLGTTLDATLNQYIAAIDLPELEYDTVQIFGFEGAGILFGRLNSRFEVAYNLTEDFKGDDPWVHNNSLGWVAGFDIDLPIHNINFNIQENGKYILNYDKIEDNVFSPLAGTPYAAYASKFSGSYKEYDVDYTGADTPWNNKLIVDITDTWNHEKIKLDLKGIWGIERGDLIVMPTLTFVVKDDFNLNLSGMYIWCKNSDSEFDGWEHNSFAQIGVKYQF